MPAAGCTSPWNGWNETDFRTLDVPIAGLAAVNDSPTTLGQPTTLTATITAGTNAAYSWAFGDGGTGSGAVVTHTYAAVGNYTAVVTASNSASVVTATTAVTISPQVINYTYDALNRLVAADYATGESFDYQYDAVGNRTVMTDSAGIHNYTYDLANRLTAVDGVTYTWDYRGNLAQDGTFTYTYDSAGRMVRAEGVTTTLVYTYNGDGLLAASGANTGVTRYTWDWASPVPEMLSDGRNVYLVGLDTLGYADETERTYHLSDALGSVRQLADGQGYVAQRYEYAPFGEPLAAEGTRTSLLRYTGEWWDNSIELLYLRARWYDPQVGIFLSRDPIRYNHPYQYVNVSPINYTDPSGRNPRPPDVCPSPTSLFRKPGYIMRHKDGSRAYFPGYWDTEAWVYCGDFWITAYQFVVESYYEDTCEIQLTPRGDRGVSFLANDAFVEDVLMNGTGKADASQPCPEQDNYISSLNYAGNGCVYSCGRGRPFAAEDAYKVVAADPSILHLGTRIYVPALRGESDPQGRGNADFTVSDTGGAIKGHRIDVFTGEGPGILAGASASPAIQYISYHHYQRGVYATPQGVPGVRAGMLGPLGVYQHTKYPWLYWGCNWYENYRECEQCQ